MKKYILSICVFTILAILFVGCSSDKETNKENLKQKVLAYIDNNKDVLLYGYVNLGTIQKKAALKKTSGISGFISTQIQVIKEGIDLNYPVYCVIQSAGKKNFKATAFFGVNNRDSLVSLFKEMGMIVQKKEDLWTYTERNISLGFNKHIGVISFSEQPEKTRDITSLFKVLDQKVKNEETAAILEEDNDILLAAGVNNLLAIYTERKDQLKVLHNNIFPSTIQKLKVKQLKQLFQGAIGVTTLNFEKGNITLKTKLANESNKLDKLIEEILEGKNGDKMLDYLGPNQPLMALVTSINIKKLENYFTTYVMDKKQLKTVYDSLFLSFGNKGAILDALAKESLANLLNGNFGLSISSTKNKNLMGITPFPNITVYAGLGEEKKNIKELLYTLAKGGKIKEIGDNTYRNKESLFQLKNNAIIFQNINTKDGATPAIHVAPLPPLKMEDFGEAPVSFYYDIEEFATTYNVSNNQQIGTAGFTGAINLLDYMSGEINSDGYTIQLFFKNKEENTLKQLKEELEKMVKDSNAPFRF